MVLIIHVLEKLADLNEVGSNTHRDYLSVIAERWARSTDPLFKWLATSEHSLQVLCTYQLNNHYRPKGKLDPTLYNLWWNPMPFKDKVVVVKRRPNCGICYACKWRVEARGRKVQCRVPCGKCKEAYKTLPLLYKTCCWRQQTQNCKLLDEKKGLQTP